MNNMVATVVGWTYLGVKMKAYVPCNDTNTPFPKTDFSFDIPQRAETGYLLRYLSMACNDYLVVSN